MTPQSACCSGMERTRAIKWSFSRVKFTCGFCSMTTTRSLARPGDPGTSSPFPANVSLVPARHPGFTSNSIISETSRIIAGPGPTR